MKIVENDCTILQKQNNFLYGGKANSYDVNMNEISANSGTDRTDGNRQELIRLISSSRSNDGAEEVLPGLFLSKSSKMTTSPSGVLGPAFCFVAQGAKRAMLGDEVFHYDPGHFLIFTVDLPLTFQVEEATDEKPYLGMRLNLKPAVVAAIMAEADIKFRKGDAAAKAMSVVPIDADLLDAVVRLVQLIERPADQN